MGEKTPVEANPRLTPNAARSSTGIPRDGPRPKRTRRVVADPCGIYRREERVRVKPRVGVLPKWLANDPDKPDLLAGAVQANNREGTRLERTDRQDTNRAARRLDGRARRLLPFAVRTARL